MIIVTGASQNHLRTLNQMVQTFFNFYKNSTTDTLIVYNLGISENDWTKFKEKYAEYTNIIYKIFDYSLYPSYLNININAGEYAWKPVIVYDTCTEYNGEIVVWMDAGNKIKNKLDPLCDFILTNHIHSSVSGGNIKEWTHPKTIEYMKCENVFAENRNAACIGLNTKTDFIKDLVKEWRDFALIKECIAPEGSGRHNHRQDQAVFSILFDKYQQKYKFNSINQFINYSIHNDID